MSYDRDGLLEQVKSKAIVHGRVTLASGKEADYYVDLRRITLDAAAAPLIGPAMLELTKDLEYDAVGGLTLGADPVAMSMLHAAAQQGRTLDAFVVRKAEKTHGLQRRIEGPDVKGRRVLAVEDTSTTGGSVLTAVEALREAGAEVVAVAVIVDRATGAQEKVEVGRPGVPDRVRSRGTGARLMDSTRPVSLCSRSSSASASPTSTTTGRRSAGRCSPALAAQYGWSYLPANNALAGQWSGTPFQTGDNRRAKNVLSGRSTATRWLPSTTATRPTRPTRKARTTTTHNFGVVVLQLPGALPHLEVTHEGIFGGAVANALGFRDIQFESEQFNRAFRVKADDERFGHAVVTPRMMELLLARGEIGWRIEGNSLVGWDKGAHNPNEVMNRLSLLAQVRRTGPAVRLARLCRRRPPRSAATAGRTRGPVESLRSTANSRELGMRLCHHRGRRGDRDSGDRADHVVQPVRQAAEPDPGVLARRSTSSCTAATT